VYGWVGMVPCQVRVLATRNAQVSEQATIGGVGCLPAHPSPEQGKIGMDVHELIARLEAYSATYESDSCGFSLENKPKNAAFALGKSEAFATAAEWLQHAVTEGKIG
jgi:hypothetical protein